MCMPQACLIKTSVQGFFEMTDRKLYTIDELFKLLPEEATRRVNTEEQLEETSHAFLDSTSRTELSMIIIARFSAFAN